MVEKPAYCLHCHHRFEYDTDTAKAGTFRYTIKCPDCGKRNRVLKSECNIVIGSLGFFASMSLLLYFSFHQELYPSIILGLVAGLAVGLTSYYFRVLRLKKPAGTGHRPPSR